jgi:hypothetical protein
LSFNNLQLIEPVLKALQHEGYITPTPIQQKAIPLILQKRDLLGCAQTGTGKTAAFTLPALELISKPSQLKGKGPRILVLTPTRELANQVTDAVRSYGKFMRVKSGAILGGMPYREQLALLGLAAGITDGTRRATRHRDGIMTEQLKPPQCEQWHKTACVKAIRRRIKATIECGRLALQARKQSRLVSAVRN